MPRPIKLLLFVLASAALLADVGFIIWATKLNFLVLVPALLAAFYLSYVAAHYTIIKVDEKNESDSLGIEVQEARPRVHELGGESAAGGTQPVTHNGGDVAYPRAKAS